MTKIFFIFSERLENFNEIFRKDVAYNNIKRHEKLGFHSLIRRYIFRKTTGGRIKLIPATVLGLNILNMKDLKECLYVENKEIRFAYYIDL